MNKAFLDWYSKFGLMDDGHFILGPSISASVKRIAHRAYQRGRKDGRDMPKRTYRPQEEKEQ